VHGDPRAMLERITTDSDLCGSHARGSLGRMCNDTSLTSQMLAECHRLMSYCRANCGGDAAR
jgi:hypothetical protein